LIPFAPAASARSASVSGSSRGLRRRNGTSRPFDAAASARMRSFAPGYPSGSASVKNAARPSIIPSASISRGAVSAKPSGSFHPVCVWMSNGSTPGTCWRTASCQGRIRWSAYIGAA
jgi:hypothetical protein